jgi:hypothetical protein
MLQGAGGSVVAVNVVVACGIVEVAVEGIPVAVCVDIAVALGCAAVEVGITVLVPVAVGVTSTVGVPRQPLSTVITPVMLGW